MFKNVNDKVLKGDFWLNQPLLTKKEIESALKKAVAQVDLNIAFFQEKFPSPQTFNNTYQQILNTEWTNGFWTGILWLCYEFTNDNKYKNLALQNVASFEHRLRHNIAIDHHDLGFLYSLSCVAASKLVNDEKAKFTALKAAYKLAGRYHEKEGFIQAWNSVNGDSNFRLIIDCLLNIPLLYWASRNGKINYDDLAITHFNNSLKTVIRNDGTTYHTYYYDPITAQPLYGKTRQGYQDDSCWARGQAWGIYGIGLTWSYLGNDPRLDSQTLIIFQKVVNQFLNNQASDDHVAYWDLFLNNEPQHPRDSSASAIAVCGMLTMLPFLAVNSNQKIYLHASHCILRSLIEQYAVYELKPGAPILYHGVYSWHSNKGVDEGNIWGDYFYLEALVKLWKKWEPYW